MRRAALALFLLAFGLPARAASKADLHRRVARLLRKRWGRRCGT